MTLLCLCRVFPCTQAFKLAIIDHVRKQYEPGRFSSQGLESRLRADLKLHVHTQQGLENPSMKLVFDFVVPLFSCKDIFKTQNFNTTLYPLAILSQHLLVLTILEEHKVGL